MEIRENFSLRPFNTFGIDAGARFFAGFSDADELASLLTLQIAKKQMILGGGSNVLFTGDFDGLVLLNRIRGIELRKEDTRHVYVRAGAGENWHEFVLYCIDREFAGVENLALIPGSVGAAPMQNIGAYGVEIKDVFHELEAWDLQDNKLRIFTNTDCAFGYRESVFKNTLKDRFVIVNVTFRLNKVPEYNTTYGAIEEELGKMNQSLSIQTIARAVMNIRTAKLPDPRVIGNAGSFFKNPVVDRTNYEHLKRSYPGMPAYVVDDNKMKLAAAWLIEQCGWKGYRQGDAGCHEKQALVLVNHGSATGTQILNLSQAIADSVLEKFGIHLEREVNIV